MVFFIIKINYYIEDGEIMEEKKNQENPYKNGCYFPIRKITVIFYFR